MLIEKQECSYFCIIQTASATIHNRASYSDRKKTNRHNVSMLPHEQKTIFLESEESLSCDVLGLRAL